MGHKRSQNQILSNVRMDGRYIEDVLPVSGINNTDGLLITEKNAPIALMQARATGLTIPFTDAGVNGGNWSPSLFTFPASQIFITATYAYVNILSVAGGVSASGAVTVACGSAAGDGALTGTEVDFAAAAAVNLTAGAGAGTSKSSIVGVQLDATSGTQGFFLNFHVADANLSADGSIVADLMVRTFFFDASRGN
jgi:hypothetical protein